MKKHGPNGKTDQSSRKRTKQDGDRPNAEFKTLFIRMLKELSEDLHSMKMIQSETKDTLIEIKNNLQGNNSGVNKAKNQINDLEQKEAKNNQSEQQEEKRIPKMRIM